MTHPIMAKANPADLPDLLTIQLAFTHVPQGEEASVHQIMFQSHLKTKQEPYRRNRLLVPSAWTELDMGHIAEPGLVILENRSGAAARAQQRPTPEELEAVAKRILQVGVVVESVSAPGKKVESIGELPPQYPMVFKPTSWPLMVRSLDENPVSLSYTILPR